MSALSLSSDGKFIFLAVEDATSGNQKIIQAERADLEKWTQIYNPGAGGAGSVIQSVANPDKMLFFGYFDTNKQIQIYTISSGDVTDISPAALGAKVCNTLEVNPSGGGEAWATIDTDQDLLRTQDVGATWPALDAAMGFDPTALDVLWSGGYALDRGFIAGKPASVELQYTPSEGADKQDQANAGLAAVANICSIIAIPN